MNYAEGLLVGYRWFDIKNIEPQFPFGFGLSYTTFKYSGLKLLGSAGAPPEGTNEIVTAQFEIENAGAVAGAEVAPLYIHPVNSSVTRPEKELKGFKKVFLQPGERQTVSIALAQNAFAFYDPDKKGWVAEKGDYKILVGGSSRDIAVQSNYRLAETVFEKD